jgi:hypothetical protein
VQRLPDTSLTAALATGGRQHFGWGHDRHLAASTFDAVNANTRASGHFKKPPKIPGWPRPAVRKKPDNTGKRPVTVAELYQHFTARR